MKPLERRKADSSAKFIAPLVAAVLGSSPATYVSFEMYTKVSERALVNQTELLSFARWQARQELKTDNLAAGLRDIEREVTDVKIKLASKE